LKVRKLFVLHKYYSDYYENLHAGRFDTAEQLYLSLKRRLHLTKMHFEHTEVINEKIKFND